MLSKERTTLNLIRCLVLALFLSTISFLSNQSASANIPASARLIGNGQGSTSTILNTNGLSATEFASALLLLEFEELHPMVLLYISDPATVRLSSVKLRLLEYLFLRIL